MSLTLRPASRISTASLYVPRSAGAMIEEKNVPLPGPRLTPSGDEPEATLLAVVGSMARQKSVYVCESLPAAGRFEYWTMRSDASLRCRTCGTRRRVDQEGDVRVERERAVAAPRRRQRAAARVREADGQRVVADAAGAVTRRFAAVRGGASAGSGIGAAAAATIVTFASRISQMSPTLAGPVAVQAFVPAFVTVIGTVWLDPVSYDGATGSR